MDGFTIRADAGVVTLSLRDSAQLDPLADIKLTPGGARQLARNLDLYAEKAERVDLDPQADVGPREGALPDLAAWASAVVPEG